MATIEITGLERIAHKLRTIEQISTTLGPPMKRSLMHLQRRVARAPRKDPTAFRRLATKAQKAEYWSRVRAGIINHGPNGYVRTNTLTRKWSTEVNANLLGVTGNLTNNTEYGPLVQDRQYQRPYHRASGWPTVDDVAEKEAPAVQRYFDAAIKRAID